MYIVFYVDTYVVNEEVAVEGKEISFLFEHVWGIVEYILLKV